MRFSALPLRALVVLVPALVVAPLACNASSGGAFEGNGDDSGDDSGSAGASGAKSGGAKNGGAAGAKTGGAAGAKTGGAAGAKTGGAGGSKAGNGGAAGAKTGGAAGSAGTAGSGGKTSGCGDGKIEGTEACDGDDFGTATCASVLKNPKLGGLLTCKACVIITQECTVDPTCGDGKLDQKSEDCDLDDFGGATCTTVKGPTYGGKLACNATCKLDTTGCKTGGTCGDGSIDPGEECDTKDVGTASCATATGMPTEKGFLGCTSDCKFDTTKCAVNPYCGDGVRNASNEDCDGKDLNGQTCQTALADTHAVGTLGCNTSTCKFDKTGCSIPPYCGDGKKATDEACDGKDFGTATCATEKGVGFAGVLACSATCTVDASKCSALPTCGDGIVNQTSEQCDGESVGDKTCVDIVGNGSTGTLKCNPATCLYDTSSCTAAVNCGNGKLDADEACDDTLFGSATCASILGDSHATGTLVCNTCQIDSSGCSIAPYCGDGKPGPGEDCDTGDDNDPACVNCKFDCGGAKYDFSYNGHCYVGYNALDWADAKSNCEFTHGYLAVMDDPDENDAVYEKYGDCGIFCSDYKNWIGLTDQGHEGTFTWVNGAPVSFTQWDDGEPNNSNGDENCVEMIHYGDWNDNNCAVTKTSICEYEPVFANP